MEGMYEEVPFNLPAELVYAMSQLISEPAIVVGCSKPKANEHSYGSYLRTKL